MKDNNIVTAPNILYNRLAEKLIKLCGVRILTEQKTQAEKFLFTVIISDNTYSKEENNKFFDSVFACQLPIKVIVQRSMLENGNFPLEYLNRENVQPLHGDDFVKEARKRAKGEKVIVLKKPCVISEKTFEKLASLHLKGKLFEVAAGKIINNSK